MANFKSFAMKTQYQFEKHKGLIFTLVSAGCEIAAVILMAKQAPKADKVLAKANKKIEKLKEEINDTELILNNEINVEDHKKEIKKEQRATFIELAKIYAGPAILTGTSLAFMGGSYKVMRDKEIALGAAYVTLDNAFKSYRNRVKERHGEKEELEIFRDIREAKNKKTVEDQETGEIKEIEEVVKKAHSGGGYEIWFDAGSTIWNKSGRANYETLMGLQKQANILLKMNGFLTLYDVIDMLAVPKTTIDKDLLLASKIVGWIYDPYDDTRSSWVSFGISDESGHYNEVGLSLFNNEERDVLLSFNPDGNIFKDKNGKSFVDYIKD